ncbi:MAG: MarR family transcriptional regulator [Eubacteriales bacterium]|nr:MarR family transcriptional regulator [Eubacteriales bacterium]
MLNRNFARIYRKFKLLVYSKIMQNFSDDSHGALSAMDVISMEVIIGLGRPTVNEFARFAGVSTPNAVYKINRLVDKGYAVKEQSQEDKREFHIVPTDKYEQDYGSVFSATDQVCDELRRKFSQKELANFDKILRYIGDELLPEVNSVRDLK